MRFLADENLPGPVVRHLRGHGLDVAWIREVSPGLPDEAVLAWSQSEGRVLLTLDKDFGDLARRRGLPASCGVVLFRLQVRHPGEMTERMARVLLSRNDWAGRFSVVEETGIRSTRV